MLRYAGPFLFLGAIPALYYAVGPAAPLLSVLALLAALTGAELVAPRGDAPDAGPGTAGFRTVVLGYIPLQVAATAWAIWLSPGLGAWGFLGLALSLGVTTGVFGVLAAHEAVHGGDRYEALLGTALLTTMSYRHFRVAHLHGHHRHAATPRDPATARLGESFYGFLLRSVLGQVREAWAFERRRAGWRENRALGDAAVMTVLLGAIAVGLGPRALGYFLAQSAVAVTVLELFNYIAHYGLVRGQRADGRPERLSDRHSWNSSNVLANALIFNMGRHSAHHRQSAEPYQRLKARPGPELPFGYAGSILLALVPPLWRRTMDDAARAWRA
jgi:alkane 1-monooxygenase